MPCGLPPNKFADETKISRGKLSHSHRHACFASLQRCVRLLQQQSTDDEKNKTAQGMSKCMFPTKLIHTCPYCTSQELMRDKLRSTKSASVVRRRRRASLLRHCRNALPRALEVLLPERDVAVARRYG